MCDDTWNRYWRFLQRTSEVLHRYDDSNLITTTLMDLRKPERVEAEDWAKWRGALDFPLTYLYPMQKGWTFGGGEDIEGGLEDVQRLAQHAQQIWGQPLYLQQWCQAHMQGHAFRRVGLNGRTLFVPSCEQQRLLTYMMLTAGTRGILYFSSYGLSDERLGMGRRAELGLTWGELEPVEDIIGAGEIAECETSDPSVEAKAFTRGAETVVLVVKHGEQYNRYVDEALVEDLRITLPSPPPDGAQCRRLDGPQPRGPVPPPEEGPSFTVAWDDGTFALERPLDVTAALLITPDEGRIAGLERQREAWAPLAARLAATAAADTGAKTHVVARYVGPLIDDAFRQRMVEGDEAFEEVLTHLNSGTYEKAWMSARSAMRSWRQARAMAIRRAEAEHQRLRLDEQALRQLNIYAALPFFVAEHLGGDPVAAEDLRQGVLDRLSEHDFLTREPTPEGGW